MWGTLMGKDSSLWTYGIVPCCFKITVNYNVIFVIKTGLSLRVIIAIWNVNSQFQVILCKSKRCLNFITKQMVSLA